MSKNKCNLLLVSIVMISMFSLVLVCSCSRKKVEYLRNSQVYADALNMINNDKKVMIILLDGFGYTQYERSLKNAHIPFVGSISNISKSKTYFPPISPVGMAAMVTGQPPEKNGIKKRGDMVLNKQDIFAAIQDIGKKAVLIEGDIKLINTSIEPLLNIDEDKDGFTDREVFNAAIKEFKNNPDLIFIHFHGIDDAAHKYGPYSEEAMSRTEVLDGYIKELYHLWEGSLIITADHGLHEENGRGTHGEDIEEDMFVPYILYDEGTDKQ